MSGDGYYAVFAGMPKLRKLEMRQPALQELYAGDCCMIDSQLELLVDNLPQLTKLDIGNR